MPINWEVEKPEPIAAPHVPRGSMLHVCERCGQQHIVKRAGVYGDELFLEVWHERFALEAEVKELRRQLAREIHAHSNTRDLLQIADGLHEHTWPLALEALQRRVDSLD